VESLFSVYVLPELLDPLEVL